MSIDKNKAIITYLITCPAIRDNPLFFNFIDAKDDNKQIVTLSDDVALQKPFIDGSVLKQYSFVIVDYKSITYQAIVKLTGYSNENVDEMFETQGIIDWVAAQNDAGNYPNFGADCQVEKIEAVTENPKLAGIDVSSSPALARYHVSIKVTYLDNSKKLWT